MKRYASLSPECTTADFTRQGQDEPPRPLARPGRALTGEVRRRFCDERGSIPQKTACAVFCRYGSVCGFWKCVSR